MSVDTEKSDIQPLLLMGRTGKPHGLMGEVKVIPETDDPDRFLDLDTLYIGKSLETASPHQVESVRFQESKYGITVILKLGGVKGRDGAETLRGLQVFAHEDDLPPLGDDEFYLHDLIGLDVEIVGGDMVGTIGDVLEMPTQFIYVVKRKGKPDALIPAVPEFIEDIDLEAGRIVVRPIEGLLD